jgi:electron transfer flavoprotein alpha subunit
MARNVWVLAEEWQGEIAEITYEMLALARELADGLGVAVEALLLGHANGDLAASLGAADKVLSVDHDVLATPDAAARARVIAELAQEHQPRLVLVPLTNVSADEAGLLSGSSPLPFVNSCADVAVEGDSVLAYSLLYGGKMQAAVPLNAPTAILGILPGCRPAAAGQGDGAAPVEKLEAGDITPSPVRFKRYIAPEAGDVDITRYDVLIGVGRGIQNEMNLEVAEELADALGGTVCGSRPVIDQGWLPLSRQVGKSGVSVKPKLYIAAGISGAPEHVEGIKDADLIVAINTDPEAPIFNVAHYGIVEDALDVMEGVTEAMLARKE